MAQDRTTTTYPTDATEATNYRNAYVTPLRAAFVSGNVIRSTDINLLRSAISTFNGHTHSALDYQQRGEYGNNGPRDVLAANPRVSSGVGGASLPTEVSAGSAIAASTINTYVNACNTVRSHTHPIIDNTP